MNLEIALVISYCLALKFLQNDPYAKSPQSSLRTTGYGPAMKASKKSNRRKRFEHIPVPPFDL